MSRVSLRKLLVFQSKSLIFFFDLSIFIFFSAYLAITEMIIFFLCLCCRCGRIATTATTRAPKYNSSSTRQKRRRTQTGSSSHAKPVSEETCFLARWVGRITWQKQQDKINKFTKKDDHQTVVESNCRRPLIKPKDIVRLCVCVLKEKEYF